MRKKILYVVFITLITFVLCEVGLRLMGYQPYQPPPVKFKFSPSSCFSTDSLWGIQLVPGAFTVTINDSLTYHATHNHWGERICSTGSNSLNLPQWWFLGCSMTYGMGVSDTSTYTYKLQQSLPQIHVRNMSIPGTGTLHQYLRLKQALDKGEKPQAVFFSYLDFHDDRNVFSSSTAKMMGAGVASNNRPAGSSSWGYAYARKQNQVYQMYIKDLNHPWASLPGVQYLSMSNFMQQIWDAKNDASLNMQDVSRHYLLESYNLCKAKNISFSVVFMKNGGENERMMKFCHDQNIQTIDISVDFTNPAMSNLPYDSHPSALAHTTMAAKFLKQVMP